MSGTTFAPYIGLDALIVNLAVCAVLTLALDRAGVPRRGDETCDEQYADAPFMPPATTTLGRLAPT